MAFETEAII